MCDLDGKVLARLDAKVDANAIAKQRVQDPVVPPALGKVGQLMLQTVLHHLKQYREEPAEPIVSVDQRFAVPTKYVSEHKDIKLRGDGSPIQGAISGIRAFWQRHTEIVVDEPSKAAGILLVLEQEPDEKDLVGDAERVHSAPKDGMWSNKGGFP